MSEGLYGKFVVYKRDEFGYSTAPYGEPLEGCFVLRPEKDRAAQAALRAYAEATQNAALKRDLLAWLQRVEPLSEAERLLPCSVCGAPKGTRCPCESTP